MKKAISKISKGLLLLLSFAICVAVIIIMEKTENECLLLLSKIIFAVTIVFHSVRAIRLSIKEKSKVRLGISIVCAFFAFVYCVVNLLFVAFYEEHRDLFMTMYFAVYPLMFLSTDNNEGE